MTPADDLSALTELPRLDRPLGSLRFPLQRQVSPDDDRAFTLVGAGLRAEGGCARGLDRLATPAATLLATLHVDGAEPGESLRTPLGLERELRLGDTSLVERMALSVTEPVAFLEWEADGPVDLRLRWRHPAAPGDAPRWQVLDRGLVVQSGGRRVIVALSEPPAELVVTRPDQADGRDPAGVPGLEVRASVTASVLRMAVGETALPTEASRLLRVMGRPHVVVPAARAAAQRVLDERLAVEAPAPALAETVSWAAIRLAWSVTAVRWPEAGTPERENYEERAVRHALASLLSGDPEPARRLVAAPPVVEPAGGGGLPTARRYLDLVARYLAWTGDRGTIRGVWEAVRSGAVALLETPGAPAWPAGLAEMAEDAGDGELAARLAGQDSEPPDHVSTFRIGSSNQLSDPYSYGAGCSTHDVLRLVLSDRRNAENGNVVRGEPGGAVPGAAVVEAVVHGLLDAKPDAARGRLVLRPRLPTAWDRFLARNLVVGPAAVDIEYSRAGSTHRFALRQGRGGPPLQVVFEPELPGRALVATRVDGQPASLDAAAVAGRVRTPVQLVLDHERVLEVEMRPDDH